MYVPYYSPLYTPLNVYLYSDIISPIVKNASAPLDIYTSFPVPDSTTNTASTLSRLSTSSIPSSNPSANTVVDKASASIELVVTIVTLITPLSNGYPVLGSKI